MCNGHRCDCDCNRAVAIATAMSVAVVVGIRIAIPVPVALLQGLLARALRAASARLARRMTNYRTDLAGPAATPITSPLPPLLSRWLQPLSAVL